MPKIGKSGSTLGKPISIRLPPDEEAFYRREAAAHRMPLNGYLTKLLVQGVVAENMLEFSERLESLVARIPTELKQEGGGIPDHIALSLFTSEALLTAIVTAQDEQTLYAAQDAAKAKLKKLKEGRNG